MPGLRQQAVGTQALTVLASLQGELAMEEIECGTHLPNEAEPRNRLRRRGQTNSHQRGGALGAV